MNQVLEIMGNHRSIRKFKEKSINQQVILEVAQTSQLASTSNNLQAYSLIVVRNQQKKEKLAALSGNQQHVIDCPVFLVFCADLHRSLLCMNLESNTGHLNTIESFIVATVDVALYAQNFMIAAESVGLGGVYIGGIRNNPSEVCELLNIPDYVYPVFGMCLGYPDEKYINEKKPRLPIEAVLHEESYQKDEEQLESIELYNRIMKDYYASRNNSKRQQTWSQSVAEHYKNPRREHLGDFLLNKKFGLK